MASLLYPPVTTPCVISTQSCNGSGYPSLTFFDGKRIRTVTQHRVVYAKTHNLTPADMKDLCVMHKCDVRNCINPDHLYLGTKQDNNTDKQLKGRALGLNLDNKFSAKLTADQVRAIRAEFGYSSAVVAKKFGIAPRTVRDIWNKLTWKHLD